MLTRRELLKRAAVGTGGIALGTGVVTFGRRLLQAEAGGSEISLPVPGFDEEFTAPLSGAWHNLASSNGQYDVNETVPGQLYFDGLAGQTSLGIYRSIPEIPFTVTAKITEVVNDASSFSDVGVLLGEETPGAFIHGCWDVPFLGQFWLKGSYWSSPTVWVQNIQSGNFNMGGTAVPHYSRFVVNAQDDVDGYFSTDGESWTQWLNGYNPPFTIGSVGLDLHGDGISMTVDWLRFT